MAAILTIMEEKFYFILLLVVMNRMPVASLHAGQAPSALFRVPYNATFECVHFRAGIVRNATHRDVFNRSAQTTGSVPFYMTKVNQDVCIEQVRTNFRCVKGLEPNL